MTYLAVGHHTLSNKNTYLTALIAFYLPKSITIRKGIVIAEIHK